jgi:hypothetical protein
MCRTFTSKTVFRAVSIVAVMIVAGIDASALYPDAAAHLVQLTML